MKEEFIFRNLQLPEKLMIAIGEKAPAFALKDHLGRTVKLEDFAGKRHVLLVFYPLDFTPT